VGAQLTEGQLSTVRLAHFSGDDGNTNPGAYQATISRGDGSSAGQVSRQGFSHTGFTVDGGHSYAEEGNYTATIDITDSDGDSLVLHAQMTVADASLTASGTNVSALAGASFTATMANFSDADPGGLSTDCSATIHRLTAAYDPPAITRN
jgi:hypothetical protein